jgi:predicted nucleic acid-binding Zn finger protein
MLYYILNTKHHNPNKKEEKMALQNALQQAQRIERAKGLKVDGHFVESSMPGRFYKIDPEKKTCTCPDFIYRCKSTGMFCKHIIAHMNN